MTRVLVVAVPEVEILDIAGPIQVFDEARRRGAGYRLTTCSTHPNVRTDQGQWLAELEPLPAVTAEDLVIVPGFRMQSLRKASEPALLRWLRQAERAGAHVASVCTGAFLLAAAGLLDGRECTTHWERVDELQRCYPRAKVLRDRLFVTDGRITTSAGIASGIDMSLALVERDHGPQLVAAVAREMVVYMRRDGSQRQQSVYLDYRGHLHPGVHRVQDWLVAHATERTSLTSLGRRAAMSPRHLTRVFREATGIAIGEFVTRLRLERAQMLLHDPDLTLEAIARLCGFSSARQLRHSWRDIHGGLPSEERGAREVSARAPAKDRRPRR